MDDADRLTFKRGWAFLRFAAELIVLATLVTLAAIPALSWMGIRAGPGALAIMAVNALLSWKRTIRWVRWKSHQREEWADQKPVLEATPNGLIYENGGPAQLFAWEQVISVMIHRKIAPWKTHGSFTLINPYWLEIVVRFERGSALIEVAPWEVRGGLRALRHFAERMRLYRETAMPV